MSIITLGMLKSSYVYEEIIDRMVLIPLPTNREYTSPKERNGYKDQVFSNDDMPSSILAKCMGVTKLSADGKVHPVCYSEINLIEEFFISGLTGYENGISELDFICKFFTRQEKLYDVRSANMKDTMVLYINNAFKPYWLASSSIDRLGFDIKFNLKVKGKGGVRIQHLYSTDGEKEEYGAWAVRPVFILDTEVLFPERKINWI